MPCNGGGLPRQSSAAGITSDARSGVHNPPHVATEMDSAAVSLLFHARRASVAACIALVLTAATLWTGWSLLSRVAMVLSQRQIIRQQIRDVDQYWQAAKKLPEEAIGFADVTEAIRIVTADEEAADKAEAVAAATLGVLKKTISDNLEQLSAKLTIIEQLQNSFEAEFGRRVELRPGPPPTYDAGPQPPLVGPDNPRMFIDWFFQTGRSHLRYGKWKGAAEACTIYNKASRTLYPVIAQSQQEAALAEQSQRKAAALLADSVVRHEGLKKQLKAFTESPSEIIPEIDRLRRRLANSWPVLAMFAASDLLALIPCGIASVLAWSRVALIAKRFSPRQLSRV